MIKNNLSEVEVSDGSFSYKLKKSVKFDYNQKKLKYLKNLLPRRMNHLY